MNLSNSPRKMPVTRNTPDKGGWGKKATHADDDQAEDQQVEPTNNTAQTSPSKPQPRQIQEAFYITYSTQ